MHQLFFVKDCSSSSECESVQCFENRFDADGTALNGCEAGCAQLPQAWGEREGQREHLRAETHGFFMSSP
jgi:hypothetical protein